MEYILHKNIKIIFQKGGFDVSKKALSIFVGFS
jgi:hypothetical protein